MQAWETSIDRQLVARLARPIMRPGVIRMALVRRILAGVATMTARLPLLGRFGRRRELAATTPIVYPRWTPPAPVETTTPRPVAHPIVHAMPSRVVERSSAPASAPALTRELSPPAAASPIAPNHTIERVVDHVLTSIAALEPPATVTRERASGAESHPLGATTTLERPSAAESHPLAPATASPIAPNHANEQLVERVSASTATLEPLATLTLERASEARPEASHASSRELARSTDPVVRRSRVGAPLPARPQIARPIEGHVHEPARALIAPSAPATATTTSRGEASGRSIEQAAGEVRTRGATANPVVRIRPRATAAGLPAMTAATIVPARTPVVAPTTARQAPLPVPAIRPNSTPAGTPGRSLVESRPVPVVPTRSGDGERARSRELPLAHPSPATAPAAIAALPSAATPHPLAAPHPLGQAAAPPAPPPQKIDLPRLAEQVQRILVRQAAHTRARQGLPR